MKSALSTGTEAPPKPAVSWPVKVPVNTRSPTAKVAGIDCPGWMPS